MKGVKGGGPLFLGAIVRARGSSVKGLSSMIVCFILSVILVSLIIFPIAQVSAECSIMWNQTYGGTEWDRTKSLVVTSDGGYAIAGYANSFGAGNADAWLVKTDASGNMVWNQTYSFGAGDYDFWLVKTDAEDVTEPLPDGALPMEYAYIAVAAVFIAVAVIGIIAYKKRK